MNLKLLIDGIVRQTTVLVAQLSTSAGVRAPLAHIANEVFRNGNQGPNFQHHVVTVGDRVLVAARSDDQRLGTSIYLAWIRP
jgi:hypothetical protein